MDDLAVLLPLEAELGELFEAVQIVFAAHHGDEDGPAHIRVHALPPRRLQQTPVGRRGLGHRGAGALSAGAVLQHCAALQPPARVRQPRLGSRRQRVPVHLQLLRRTALPQLLQHRRQPRTRHSTPCSSSARRGLLELVVLEVDDHVKHDLDAEAEGVRLVLASLGTALLHEENDLLQRRGVVRAELRTTGAEEDQEELDVQLLEPRDEEADEVVDEEAVHHAEAVEVRHQLEEVYAARPLAATAILLRQPPANYVQEGAAHVRAHEVVHRAHQRRVGRHHRPVHVGRAEAVRHQQARQALRHLSPAVGVEEVAALLDDDFDVVLGYAVGDAAELLAEFFAALVDVCLLGLLMHHFRAKMGCNILGWLGSTPTPLLRHLLSSGLSLFAARCLLLPLLFLPPLLLLHCVLLCLLLGLLSCLLRLTLIWGFCIRPVVLPHGFLPVCRSLVLYTCQQLVEAIGGGPGLPAVLLEQFLVVFDEFVFLHAAHVRGTAAVFLLAGTLVLIVACHFLVAGHFLVTVRGLRLTLRAVTGAHLTVTLLSSALTVTDVHVVCSPLGGTLRQLQHVGKGVLLLVLLARARVLLVVLLQPLLPVVHLVRLPLLCVGPASLLALPPLCVSAFLWLICLSLSLLYRRRRRRGIILPHEIALLLMRQLATQLLLLLLRCPLPLPAHDAHAPSPVTLL
mmetsp:Transcript_17667/g.68570  ORF Transcript_17667/g.68570 Transcript_17667/m.68570 type:complete len:682 (-) Transcript_17667:47-2092(-)